LGSFFATSWPCIDFWYCCASSLWHDEQSTFFVIVSHGRRREAFTSLWHWLQAIFACREPLTSAMLTVNE